MTHTTDARVKLEELSGGALLDAMLKSYQAGTLARDMPLYREHIEALPIAGQN